MINFISNSSYHYNLNLLIQIFITQITMFKNLHCTNKKKFSYLPVKHTYTKLQSHRSYLKQTSYSKLYQIRKTIPNPSLDFHVVHNNSYIYQGQWYNSEKDGEGIALLKNGSMIIGHWQRDKLNGRSLIFTPYGGILSAEFIDNKLNGWVLAQYNNKVVITNLYFEDRVDGPRLTYEGFEEMWIASNFTEDGKFVQITNVEKGIQDKLPLFVQNDQLAQLFEKIIIRKDFTFDFEKIKLIDIMPGTQYIGYVDEQYLPQGLGATYSSCQCFFGLYHRGQLNQFGRMVFSNGDIYHGGIQSGTFVNKGIYYSPKKNSTVVIITSHDGQTQVIQQQRGYYHLDFQYKIGQRISKEDKIILSSSTQMFLKTLEKYYHQYCIQSKIKQQEKYSILSQRQTDPVKLNDIDESNLNQMIKLPQRKGSLTKWVGRQDGGEGYSEECSNNEDQFMKSDIIEKRPRNQLQSPKSPKSPQNKQPSNQFNSIAIKENEEPNEGQMYGKQNPRADPYKQQQFTSQSKILNSKSLDIKQLTFRHLQDKNDPQLRREYIDDQMEVYDDRSRQIRAPVIEVHQVLSQHSSLISNMEEKLNGVLKKSNLRRKIFG